MPNTVINTSQILTDNNPQNTPGENSIPILEMGILKTHRGEITF